VIKKNIPLLLKGDEHKEVTKEPKEVGLVLLPKIKERLAGGRGRNKME